MAQHVILIPKLLTAEKSLSFAAELMVLPVADEYVFDFQRLEKIEPFALLLLSSEIQRCIEYHPNVVFSVVNYQSKTYAANMGFFKAFGADYGARPRNKSQLVGYLPINIITTDSIRRQAAEKKMDLVEFVEKMARRLSNTLTLKDSGNLFDTVAYVFAQGIENVLNHSRASRFGYCAQYWPQHDLVELAWLDRGIGIKTSLGRSLYLEIENDQHAIDLSLMPGLSGEHVCKYPLGIANTTGPGLYMMSCLGRDGGSFFIASGNTSLLLSKGETKYLTIPNQGTAVRIVLKGDKLNTLKNSLAKYAEERYSLTETYSISECTNVLLKASPLMIDFAD